ncbi:Calcium proton exchanger [Lentinula edodes]|uniref:Calcium proton exchanger n=1 Tax=Lentinula edodes TaxID=5353 RepID=A0A1Q3EHV6_LENED|nr:Calcium proton exchanger [Lentinula edodes]
MNLTEFLNDTMEYIATGLDQKHTGILNASFGNIVKFFVGIAVLFQGKIVIVQNMGYAWIYLGKHAINLRLVLPCSWNEIP